MHLVFLDFVESGQFHKSCLLVRFKFFFE